MPLRVSSVAGVRDLLTALLGVSAYTPAKGYGPELNDPMVRQIREAVGGQIVSQPTTRLRWYVDDLEQAQYQADAGDLMPAAQLYRAMRRDGTISGILSTLTAGLVRLPKKFYGDARSVAALKARNGSRSVFDDMFPPSELSLLTADGEVLGAGTSELVPVEGRDFPIMIRLEPEFLRYRWAENRWYFTSIAGLLPITPGDTRWVLHTPGGRVAPWLSGKWPSLGRSFVHKEHAMMYRSNYCAKLANPARAAVSPLGSTEQQRRGFFAQLMAWGVNSVFDLPPGWDVKLIELKGEGYKVFQEEIDTADREIMISLAGQIVTTDGGAGFSNSDVHRAIRSDIIQSAADGLAYTVNTQGIPQFVATRWGASAIRKGAVLTWDVTRPKDLEAEARAMTGLATAISSLAQVLTGSGRELDVDELLTRYGVPVKGDVNGDGKPDVEALDEGSLTETPELSEARRLAVVGDPTAWEDWKRRNARTAAEEERIGRQYVEHVGGYREAA